MMSGKESSAKDNDLEPIVEIKAPDPTAYIKTVIEHIETKIKEADDFVVGGEHLQAKKAFDNAVNHYKGRKHDLNQLKLNICVPSLSDLDNSETTLNTYNEASKMLVPLLKSLKKKSEKNEPAAEAETQVNTLQEKKNKANIEVKELQVKLEEKECELEKNAESLDNAYDQYIKISQTAGSTHQHIRPDESTEDDLNMQTLGAFIMALGAAAVAIAFAALNMAGLAMPGVVLAGFGVGTALLGASIFSSKAKSINEYRDNIFTSFSTPTAPA